MQDPLFDIGPDGQDDGPPEDDLISRLRIDADRAREHANEIEDRAHRLREVARMSRLHMTLAEIAEALRTSRRQIVKDRKALGLSKGAPIKMTQEELERAEALLDDGASLSEIARTLKLSERTIRRRFPGRGWTKEQTAEYTSALLSGRRYRRG